MPAFGVTLPHPLGKDAARERLAHFVTTMTEQHREQVRDMEQRWEGDHLHFSFSTSGVSISGRIIVEEMHARVEGKLPFAAVLFRGRIEQEIRDRLERLLQ